MSALIDEERRDLFEGGDVTQPNFTSAYYLTLQWLPPADDTSKASSLLYEGGAQGFATAADHLDDFERDTGRVLDMIEGVMPEAAWLSPAETLTYIHSAISTHDQRITLPETPMHLDALLATTCWSAGWHRSLATSICAACRSPVFRHGRCRGCSMSSTGWASAIAGRRGRSVSTRCRRSGC